MTGAKQFIATESGVQFKIGRNCNSINTVTIEYDEGKDLYNMKFERVSVSRKTGEVKRKLVESYSSVYFDMLQELFSSATGMDTHL